MATWIVGLILAAAVYFAARHVLKAGKSGGCAGCGTGCSDCCSCGRKTVIDFKRRQKAE